MFCHQTDKLIKQKLNDHTKSKTGSFKYYLMMVHDIMTLKFLMDVWACKNFVKS